MAWSARGSSSPRWSRAIPSSTRCRAFPAAPLRRVPSSWRSGVCVGVALSALDGTRRINVLAFPVLGVVAWNFAIVRSDLCRVDAGAARANPAPARARNARAPRDESRVAAGGEVRRLQCAARRGPRPLHARLVRGGAAAAGGARRAAAPSVGGGGRHRPHRGPLRARHRVRLPRGLGKHVPRRLAGARAALGHLRAGVARDRHCRFPTRPRSRRFAGRTPRVASARRRGFTSSRRRWRSSSCCRASRSSLAGTLFITRWSHRAPLPASLAAYFRGAFGALGGSIGRGLATVVPYAYEPSADARAGLRALLPRALGESLTLDSRAAVRYGEEEEFVRELEAAGKADVVVLLFNLAATPEEENHGDVIAGVRDWLAARQPRPQLLVLVDEGPYAERMADRWRRRPRRGTPRRMAAVRRRARPRRVQRESRRRGARRSTA